METILNLRNAIPFDNFISIRFSMTFPSTLTGHLIYLREDYKNYKLLKGDEIDHAILNAIRSFADRATVSYQTTLVTDQDLNHALHITRGGVERDFVFYFFPLGDIEYYEKMKKKGKLKTIPKSLRMRFWTTDQKVVDSFYVLQELIVKISPDAIKKLATLKRV